MYMIRGLLYRLFYPVVWLWNFVVGTTRELLLRVVLTVLLFIGYFIASMMLYTIVRHVMVPPKTLVIPVHLYFK